MFNIRILIIAIALFLFSCQNNNFEPEFVVKDKSYKQMSKDELRNLISNNIKNNSTNRDKLNYEESLLIKKSYETDPYIKNNNTSESILFMKPKQKLSEKFFNLIVEKIKEQMFQLINYGIDAEVLDYGEKKYQDKYSYRYINIFTNFNDTVVYHFQLYFDFNDKTYSIFINSKDKSIDIENLIKIVKK